jgi:hypothetical protein
MHAASAALGLLLGARAASAQMPALPSCAQPVHGAGLVPERFLDTPMPPESLPVLVVVAHEPAEVRMDDVPAGATEPCAGAHFFVRWAYPGEHVVELAFDRGGHAARRVTLPEGHHAVQIRVAPSEAEVASRHRRGIRFGLGAGTAELHRLLGSTREVVYGHATDGAAGFVEALANVGISAEVDLAVAARLGFGALPTELGFTGSMTVATPDGPQSETVRDVYASMEPVATLAPSGSLLLRFALTSLWGFSVAVRAGAEVPVAAARQATFQGAEIRGVPVQLAGSWSSRRGTIPTVGCELAPLSLRLGPKHEVELEWAVGGFIPMGHTATAFYQSFAFRYLLLP